MESLCKRYGIKTVTSKDLLTAAEPYATFSTRPLEVLNVSGRKEPLTVHEVLIDPAQGETIKAAEFKDVHNKFYNSDTDWSNADKIDEMKAKLNAFMDKYPKDIPAGLMREKIIAGDFGIPTKIS
jgi:hypothetical protein